MQSSVFKAALARAYASTADNMKLINTKVLQSAKKAYMDVLNQAYIETPGGMKSYTQAINDALKKLAEAGLSAATYKRADGTLVNYSIEAVVRRDVLTAAFQTANDSELEAMKAIGCEYVEVSSHLGARVGDGGADFTNHAWWQGKVYKIEGHDAGHPNLIETTGYGEIQGLRGINCRHRMFGWWPGDGHRQTIYDLEENAEYYRKTQKQRALERRVRTARREEALSQDTESYLRAQQKTKEAVSKLDDYTKANELRRDATREAIQDSNVYEHERWPKEGKFLEGYGRYTSEDCKVDLKYINSEEYRSKFKNLIGNEAVDQAIDERSKAVLTHRSGTDCEDMYLIDENTASITGSQTSSKESNSVAHSKSIDDARRAHFKQGDLISLHNHPLSLPPSDDDLYCLYNGNYSRGIILCHNGKVIIYNIKKGRDISAIYKLSIAKYYERDHNFFKSYTQALAEMAERYGLEYEVK